MNTGKIITEEKTALEEDPFKIVLETAAIGTFNYNYKKDSFIVSKRYLDIYDLEKNNPSVQDVVNRIHPSDLPQRNEAVQTALLTGIIDYESRVIHRDNSIHWVSVKGKFTLDENNEPVSSIGIVFDITAEKNILQELKEKELRLRLAMEASKLGTWDLDFTTDSIVYSSRIAEILGHDAAKELTHADMVEQVHPDDRTILDEALNEAFKTGEYIYDVRVIKPDRTTGWIHTKGTIIFDDDKRPVRMYGTMADTTESRAADEQINTLAAIVQSSDDAIISKQLNGIITSWNKFAERIFGYTAEEMVGQHISKLIPVDRLNEEVEIVETLRKGIRVEHFETKRVTKDGRFLDISLAISPLKNSQGMIIGASKIARDITEQKNITKALQESEEKFRLLADSMPQKVWTSDAQGNLNYFNKAVYDESGLMLEDIRNAGWLNYVHPDEKEENIKRWKHSIQTGEDFILEHRLGVITGEYRWQLSRAIPQKDPDGNIQMWVGTSTDIHQLKETEQQKDFFISIASHELKTPVTSIKGYVQILLSQYAQKEDNFLTNALVTIDKQIITLTDLISDLLDMSKIKSGALDLEKQYFNINELIDETIKEVNYATPDHTITFSPLEKDIEVFADKRRIAQALINFLTNAIKYSTNNTPVKVVIGSKNGSVSVSVKDQGIGIDKNDHEKIFERFYRVEGKDEKTYPGFGIGLFIAAEVIKKHNGKITVESEKGKGSIFSFTIPLSN